MEGLEEIALTAADIPGAELSEPWEKHPVAALKWWLGIKAPTSMNSLTVQLVSLDILVEAVLSSYGA